VVLVVRGGNQLLPALGLSEVGVIHLPGKLKRTPSQGQPEGWMLLIRNPHDRLGRFGRVSWLFAGDSLAWSMREQDLVAFRDACWYSWSALTASLAKLADYRFEWLLPGHGWPAHLAAEEMNARLRELVTRMREG